MAAGRGQDGREDVSPESEKEKGSRRQRGFAILSWDRGFELFPPDFDAHLRTHLLFPHTPNILPRGVILIIIINKAITKSPYQIDRGLQ
jgi:hypothetical protein